MITSIDVIINLALLSALAGAASILEVTDGQNATIYFDIDEVERAGEVKVSFKGDDGEKRVIAQRPWRYDDPPPPGVSLKVGTGRVAVTIQQVSLSGSGLYEARAFFRENMTEVKVQLIVNREKEPSFSSSTAPPHTSTPKPRGFRFALIPVFIIFIIIIISLCFCVWNHRRTPSLNIRVHEGVWCCFRAREVLLYIIMQNSMSCCLSALSHKKRIIERYTDRIGSAFPRLAVQRVTQSQIWSLRTSFLRTHCVFDCRHGSVCSTIAALFSLETFFTVATDALLVDGSQLEANQGETVTLPFTMEKAEKADRLRITFTSETKQKRLIAQHCDPSDGCAVVNTPGVSLIVGEGRVCVTLQRVNSSRSGIYEAQAFFGEDVCALKATLVVHEASFSSTIAPPHSSTPKPLTSDLLWLLTFLTIPLVILGGVCFWKRRRADPVFSKERTGIQ